MDDLSVEKQAELFKTLSCSTRLKILILLKDGERSVGELIDAMNARFPGSVTDRTNISKHLALLRGHGVISCVSKGKNRLYRLEAVCLLEAMECTIRLADEGTCNAPGCNTR